PVCTAASASRRSLTGIGRKRDVDEEGGETVGYLVEGVALKHAFVAHFLMPALLSVAISLILILFSSASWYWPGEREEGLNRRRNAWEQRGPTSVGAHPRHPPPGIACMIDLTAIMHACPSWIPLKPLVSYNDASQEENKEMEISVIIVLQKPLS
ncbi:hypothetical protein GW17_00019436, partial [Ensete ventricosum]